MWSVIQIPSQVVGIATVYWLGLDHCRQTEVESGHFSVKISPRELSALADITGPPPSRPPAPPSLSPTPLAPLPPPPPPPTPEARPALPSVKPGQEGGVPMLYRAAGKGWGRPNTVRPTAPESPWQVQGVG